MRNTETLRATSDVAAYPALTVRRIEPENTGRIDSDGDFVFAIPLIDGDLLVTPEHLNRYRVGTVVSYALRNGECPIDAIDRARANGHELAYAYGVGACLSDSHRAAELAYEVRTGDLVRLEGRLYRVKAAPNNNLDLVEVRA